MPLVALVVIALIVGGLGGIAWATDRHHAGYGALLPAGAAVVAAMVLWMATMAFGVGNSPATAWIPWITAIVAGGACAWLVPVLVGRRRHRRHLARQTEILQMR